jgi:hypothetical protein
MPLNAATKTFAFLAKRGAGKTYAASVFAEELYKSGIPFVVFDPIDVWWGLRLAADGKEKGLPIVIFGLENADIKLNRDMGKIIAQEVVQKNVSCVISTFGMPKTAQRHLITEFAEELLRINNTPRHVFIEEAHEFVPQRVTGGLGVCFNAVSNLVVMGRNRGIGVSLINQRSATINKDVLTQLDTLIALRSVGPQDRDALRDWVEYHAAEGNFESFISSLPSLPTGTAWIWSPEFLNVFKKIKIRSRETFHPDREKIGINFQMPSIQHSDIEDFIRRFPLAPNKEKTPIIQTKTEVPKFDDQALNALKNDYESRLVQKDIELRQLREQLDKVRGIVGVGASSSGAPPPQSGGQLNLWLSKLGSGGASRILRFLSENRGSRFTRAQLALAVGLGYSSGSYGTYLSTLKRNNLIHLKDGLFFINPDI